MPELTEDWWDCECDARYIHGADKDRCPDCGVRREDGPDAHVQELSEVTVHTDSLHRYLEAGRTRTGVLSRNELLRRLGCLLQDMDDTDLAQASESLTGAKTRVAGETVTWSATADYHGALDT